MAATTLLCATFIYPLLYTLGKRKLVETEHRTGEQHKNNGEKTEYDGALQGCLQIQFSAKQTHQQTYQCIGKSHAQHIGQRQGKRATLG